MYLSVPSWVSFARYASLVHSVSQIPAAMLAPLYSTRKKTANAAGRYPNERNKAMKTAARTFCKGVEKEIEN